MYEIRPERAEDGSEVETLFDTCFGPGRLALSSYRLRDGVPPVPELCRVLRDADGVMAGAIRFWPVAVDTHAALLLGPVAVHPTRQGEGLGAWLIADSLGDAQAWRRVLLVGDRAYYRRFGFEPLSAVQMPPPTNPDRVLGRALVPGAWDGVSGKVRKTLTAERGLTTSNP